MKVLQVVKTNDGAMWALEQALWLSKNGITIITVLPNDSLGLASKYRDEGLKIIEGDFSLPVRKPWEIIKRSKQIKSIVKEIKPDIIHCHFVTNIMMSRIALRGIKIPRFFQVPGPLHLENKIFKYSELFLSNKEDYWGGACQKTVQIYSSSQFSKEKVFLTYYGGYGGDSVKHYRTSDNKLHREFGIKKEEKLIGMVSYFYKPKSHLLQTRGLKGHEDFIDAISIARLKNPNIVGIIIGDSWGDSKDYVKKVKKYANEKCGEGIIFTGYRNDIKDIYKELDVAVHPSHSENLGGAAESLAAGVPTISTNIGGFPDIVVNGETGLTVKKKSPAELAEAIDYMIKNPRMASNMADKGKALVGSMLDIETTGTVLLEAYKKIKEDNQYGK